MGILVMALGLFVFFASGAFAARRHGSSLIQVTGSIVPTSYIQNQTTDQLTEICYQGGAKRMKGWNHPGFTRVTFSPKFSLAINSRKTARGEEVWVEGVKVDFSIVRMDVYISTEYPVGSCGYKVILDHENQHVIFHLRTYKKYMALLKRQLERSVKIPVKKRPILAASREQGREMIAGRLERFLEDFQNRCIAEVNIDNQRIDRPVNYKRIWKRCK
jgi:hypothetical protein